LLIKFNSLRLIALAVKEKIDLLIQPHFFSQNFAEEKVDLPRVGFTSPLFQLARGTGGVTD
jgi:hypothetical protein